MATVHCHAPGGLVLRLHTRVEGPLGTSYFQPTGKTVLVQPGLNSVEDEFFQAWVEQNPDQASLLSEVK